MLIHIFMKSIDSIHYEMEIGNYERARALITMKKEKMGKIIKYLDRLSEIEKDYINMWIYSINKGEVLLRKLDSPLIEKEGKDVLLRELVSPLTEKDEKEILFRMLYSLLSEKEILSRNLKRTSSKKDEKDVLLRKLC